MNRKTKEHELTKEEKRIKKQFYNQIDALALEYLPLTGHKNIFYQKGFESDDIMASVAQNLPKGHRGIIVTADEDLLQCIRPNVDFFDPCKKKLVSFNTFTSVFGIHPRKWGLVKAIAGCSTDNVKGIPGVGEKTAVQYLKNELPETYVTYKKIVSEKGQRVIKRNKRLVVLPMNGTSNFKLKKEKLPNKPWNPVAKALGFEVSKKKSRRDRDGHEGFGL